MRHIIQVYLSRSDAVSRLNFLRIDSTDMSSEPEALTAWSQFVGITISSNSGSSSNSSSGSNSISSVSSQAPITAFHPDDPLGLFDDDLLSQWIEELPEAPSQPSFLDPVQSQALLQVFRDELRLTSDSVGGNIIDLPKATKEAYKIYVDLILRQLYMLNQFIQAK